MEVWGDEASPTLQTFMGPILLMDHFHLLWAERVAHRWVMGQRVTPLPCCGQVVRQEVERQEGEAVVLEVLILAPEQREAVSQMTEEALVVAADRIISLIQAPPHQATLVLSALAYTLLYLPALLSHLGALGRINIYHLCCPRPFCLPHKDILTLEAPAPNLSPITPPPPPPRPSLTLLCSASGRRDPRKKSMMMRSF